MPTYEYRCKECEHELEAVQGFHDDPLTQCPVCGGPLRKKFGSVGISFKGSGFYKNDSRTGTSSKSASGTESSSGDAGKGDKVSTDKSSSTDTSSSADKSSSTASESNSTSSGDSGSKDKTPAAT